jgi:hypothetical protein
MPSSNVRDDLPAHYNRVRVLRAVAAAVICSLPRAARRQGVRGAGGRRPGDSGESGQAPEQPHARRALPGGPQRPYVEAAARAADVRERLRRDRPQPR